VARAGQPPTSIFTGSYAEASALDVLGSVYHLPPVLSGHNTYWMWGPGHASDRTVLIVGALGQLRRFHGLPASCCYLRRRRVDAHGHHGWGWVMTWRNCRGRSYRGVLRRLPGRRPASLISRFRRDHGGLLTARSSARPVTS